MVVIGLFVGGVMPFMVAAMTMTSVGKAAGQMVDEIRRQFREIEGAGDTYYNIYGEDSLYTCDNARIYHATPVGGSD